FIVRDQKGQLFAPEWVTALRNPEVVSADIVGNVRHLIRRDTPAAAASLAISDLAFTRSMLHGFSEATRDRFESGSEWRCEGSGATALAPYRQDGWCTYNFEVRDLHTYVANDLRVHNLCNEDGAEIDPDSVTWEEDGSEIRIGFDLENGDHVEIVNNIDLDGEYRRIESATTVYRSADGQVDIAHQRVDGEDQYYRAVAGNDGRPTLVAIEADDFSAPDTSRDQPALDIEAYDINANPDGSGFEFTGTDSNGATLSVEIDPGAGDSAGFYRTEEVTFATGVTVTRNYNDEGQLVSTLTGQTTSDGGYREVETTSNGQNVERIYDAQGTLVSQGPVADGSSTFQGGMQGLASFVALTQAIQTGQPLPIAIASLGFTANIFGSTGPNGTWVAQPGLAGAGSVLSAVASVMSLQQAIRTHDAFGGLVAGASIISNSASAYASIATEALGTAVVENALFSVATDIARVMAPTAALLSIANNLRQGNYVGAALNVVGMALQYFLPPGIGAVAAAVVNIIGGQIINSLFGKKKKVPDVWGTGHFEAQADGSLVAVAAGAHGGDQNVRSLINSFISVLDSIADNANANAPNAPPEWQVGVIAQRLPRVIGNYTGQVRIRLQDNDPVTGAVRELWYGGDGYSWNELSGQSYAFRNMNEQLVTSALEAGAFAPMWEVRTAFLQSQAGLADDGLSEMQRAQQHNHRAAAPAAGAVTAAWRPIMLDLDGNGLTIIQQAASSTFFDTRGDGFIRKTAWLGGGDGFLTLDRNGDGAITTAEELFANPGVATPWQGLDSLDWIDANGDGRITATDPVFAVLRVWRDLDSDGVNDTGELSSLSDLGITAINYRRGNFDRSGLGLQAGSPELQTALAGTRTRAVNGGLLIESTDGNVSVLATTIENQDAVSPGRDRVTGGVEDVAIDILITDLLANDRIGAATAGSLSLVSVGNATNGSV
ncbi:MAG: hypothetical protein IN818_11315, partial [Cutibacterium sp.]|nr:hypothetical protein [Cutibacterium sp.]